MSERTRTIITAAGLVLVLGLFLTHAAYYWHYISDDAFISFRYSRFLALGRGPYFNPGEHIEGYTNLLWMLILSPVIALGGESAALPAAKIIGVLCGALSLYLTFALCRFFCRLSERTSSWAGPYGVAAAGLVSVCPAYALNSTNGLGTTLLAACLMSGVFLGVQSTYSGRWRGAGLAFAAAALTRPEGIALFSLFWIVQLLLVLTGVVFGPVSSESRRPPLAFQKGRAPRHLIVDGIIVGAFVAGHFVFRWIAYDSELLPNTYYAKLGGFLKLDAWTYIKEGILNPFLGLIGIIPAWVGLFLCREIRKIVIPTFCVALAGALLPFITGTDWMPGWRFVIPFVPLTSSLVVAGWSHLGARLTRRGWVGLLFALLCIPLLFTTQSPVRRDLFGHTIVRAYGYKTGHTALAEWLCREVAEPGDSIALMDIGIVGYLCIDQRILDIVGYTDRLIAKSSGGFLSKEYDPAYILDRRPDFIVLTFTAPGDSLEPPPEDLLFLPWTDIEYALYHHKDFRELYLDRNAPEDQDGHWTSALAARLGAHRIFEHIHPDCYYLLALFRRSESP